MEEKVINSRVLWVKAHRTSMFAYAGLLVMVILFLFSSGDKLMYNTMTVFQTAAPYVIVTLGAMFIYSMGCIDVSVGQQMGVYALIIILISNRMGGNTAGVILGFVIVLALSAACGAFNGAVSVYLKLPAIVTSLFLMFFFTGLQALAMEMIGVNTISIEATIRPADRNEYTALLLIIMVIMTIVAAYFYKFTKLGKYAKAIGANAEFTKQAGVNILKWKVLCYMMFAATVAIGSFILLTRAGSAGKSTGSGFAMDVMICLILGGMKVTGGMSSRIGCALVGTFTYVLLTNVLTTLGVPLNMVNFVKAMIFILIVLITSRKRNGVLPR